MRRFWRRRRRLLIGSTIFYCRSAVPGAIRDYLLHGNNRGGDDAPAGI